MEHLVFGKQVFKLLSIMEEVRVQEPESETEHSIVRGEYKFGTAKLDLKLDDQKEMTFDEQENPLTFMVDLILKQIESDLDGLVSSRDLTQEDADNIRLILAS